jgi:hypothetical protein
MKEKLIAHYKRWNIEFDEKDSLAHLKYRLGFAVQGADSWLTSKADNVKIEVVKHFNYLAGRPQMSNTGFPTGPSRAFSGIISKAQTPADVVHALQLIFFTLSHFNAASQIEELHRTTHEALELTPRFGVELVRTDSGITLYPKGANLLDEEVVNQTLAWLEPYPNALRSFEGALQLYMAGDKGKYRNLLDNLRHALEQLLKEVLNNKKSLENQMSELLSWLKGKGLHGQTRNMYQGLLFGPYKQFHNDAVKHAEEGYSEEEIEFNIYLTGTFMRLILQLEQKPDE